ncbi:disulfide bond formation protein DsbB [Methylobacterium sp. Leaf102]|jgi:disulfide bond formation protein DsbB|uniref:disulfide bond formation protein B n=1 Tax=unclassified Methylobacterium TaxID=2615210 RepID=UPI0006FF3706|nr:MULTISPECIES: disulfide bond formation protein B [unclassified Methylobacterium]KQO62001.1 disulfide bond formation protein DsbB [Methylobacterium sp. Leaf87]KQP34145.1 disulfide bond formation protein DsbB [Methylobacterium sp. Leaf102]KQP62040.1 disulfide bond formation protein DsbB [Methylobacterium sp. Leaf112]USU33257.1 disulfide bond formation protein B [Methylobacterium sp. OTU13CASTA1]
MNYATLLRLRRSALILVVGAVVTLAAALYFQFVLGYVPCKLCLEERIPYYAAIPLGILALVLPERLSRVALGLAALGLLYGAGLSVYHAGAEWALWAGPTDCGGGTGAAPATVTDFRATLETTRVADCSTAAWRFLGVSLAGWNAVVAFVLASISGTAAAKR